MVTKSVQSIYNRTLPRDAAARLAEETASAIANDLTAFVAAFGTSDLFDLAELVALETVAAM